MNVMVLLPIKNEFNKCRHLFLQSLVMCDTLTISIDMSTILLLFLNGMSINTKADSVD